MKLHENSDHTYATTASSMTSMNLFTPTRDLALGEPKAILRMTDLGQSGTGISSVAAAGPFTMFSQTAIQKMRNELLSGEVLRKCKYERGLASYQLRGSCPE
jgi:hypothetical protein